MLFLFPDDSGLEVLFGWFRKERRGSSLVDSKPHSFSAPSAMNLEVRRADDDEDNCEFEPSGRTSR